MEYGKAFVLLCFVSGCVLTIAEHSRILSGIFCCFVILLLLLKIFIKIYSEYYEAKHLAMSCNDIARHSTHYQENELNKGIGTLQEHCNDIDGRSMPDAMPYISNSIVLGLLGSQGTGKSTLLKHLISSRLSEQQVIMDPHGLPEDYCGIKPAGLGRNYQEIDKCFSAMIDELNSRYNAGHYNHARLNIYIDELTLLNQNCKNFKPFMRVMMTESRKVNIRLVICLHSKRAKTLGLDGNFDLADGIDFLELKKENGQRWGEFETGGNVIRLALPGPFTGGVTKGADAGVTNGVNAGVDTGVKKGVNIQHPENTVRTPEKTVFGNVYTPEKYQAEIPYFIDTESEIVRMFNAGNSVTSIGQKIFGTKSGPNNLKVKMILNQNGIRI